MAKKTKSKSKSEEKRQTDIKAFHRYQRNLENTLTQRVTERLRQRQRQPLAATPALGPLEVYPAPAADLGHDVGIMEPSNDSRVALLQAAIAGAFNSVDLSDVKIYLGTLEFPAHSLVLVAQSKYFKTAFKSKFEEGMTREFRYDKSIHAHWRMLEYPAPWTTASPSHPHIFFDIFIHSSSPYFAKS